MRRLRQGVVSFVKYEKLRPPYRLLSVLLGTLLALPLFILVLPHLPDASELWVYVFFFGVMFLAMAADAFARYLQRRANT
jgi:hypothetical protein